MFQTVSTDKGCLLTLATPQHITSSTCSSQVKVSPVERGIAGDPELDAQVPAPRLPGEETGGGDWARARYREGEISDFRLS